MTHEVFRVSNSPLKRKYDHAATPDPMTRKSDGNIDGRCASIATHRSTPPGRMSVLAENRTCAGVIRGSGDRPVTRGVPREQQPLPRAGAMSGRLLDTIVLGYMVAWPTALALLAVHFTGLLTFPSAVVSFLAAFAVAAALPVLRMYRDVARWGLYE
jgi:hypothetical protein